MAMNRLATGLRALSLSAAPRPCLARTASTQSAAAAAVEIPANLVFAEEKPVPPPRVIPAAQKGAAVVVARQFDGDLTGICCFCLLQ